MSNNSARAAFVADVRAELSVVPLIGVDSTISVRRSGTGLTLKMEYGDETEFVDYDGEKWLDDEESESAGPDNGNDVEPLTVWGPLLAPALRTTGIPDDAALRDQWDEAIVDNAALIELFGTLVSGGWTVRLRHEVTGGNSALASILLNASAPVLDPERTPAVCAVWKLPVKIAKFETVWISSASADEPWSFDLARTHVAAVDGAVHTIDPYLMSLAVIGVAPSWTLQPGIDQQFERHSAGGQMAATVLAPPTLELHTEANRDEIELRRKAIDEWAESHGFDTIVRPATPKQTELALKKIGAGGAGY